MEARACFFPEVRFEMSTVTGPVPMLTSLRPWFSQRKYVPWQKMLAAVTPAGAVPGGIDRLTSSKRTKSMPLNNLNSRTE